MAGFFGLFNYEKEGPGISKNAPKKKGFIVFFETFFRNFWKFIVINLVYGLISLPVLTNGLASAGLTNVTRNIARDKHSFGVSDLWDTVKKNWKQALPAGIIKLVIYIIRQQGHNVNNRSRHIALHAFYIYGDGLFCMDAYNHL